MKEALEIMSEGLDPAGLVTHIGGLDCVPEATNNLPDLPGGKKLIYTHINMSLTAIEDFAKLGEKNPLFKELAAICDRQNGLWSVEAEDTCWRMPTSCSDAVSIGELQPMCDDEIEALRIAFII